MKRFACKWVLEQQLKFHLTGPCIGSGVDESPQDLVYRVRGTLRAGVCVSGAASALNLISFRGSAWVTAGLRLTCSLYSWLIPCQCELRHTEGSKCTLGEYAVNPAVLKAPQKNHGDGPGR